MVFSRWIFRLVQSRSFSDLLGFMFVFEAAFGLLEAHAGVHLKEVLEIVGYSGYFSAKIMRVFHSRQIFSADIPQGCTSISAWAVVADMQLKISPGNFV